MGTCFSYYDAARHVEFDMGKWWWGDENPEGAEVAMLFLSREALIAQLLEVVTAEDWSWDDAEKPKQYAAWLAEQLIGFRADSTPEQLSWVNDCDDSMDVTMRCASCEQYVGAHCCASPKPCETIGSRYPKDYPQGVFHRS